MFRRAGRRIATAPPAVVLGVAWAILLVYAHPGQMTQDSFDHLQEARWHDYTDGHPPVIAALWRLIDHVIAGQFGMLLLQSGCLLFGLYAIFKQTFAPRGAAWAAGGVFVFPPVMLPMAVIWKDCLMAGGLALGIGGLLDERRWVRVLALVPLFGATAVRYNAFGATFPAIMLLFAWRPDMHWLKRYAIAFAAWFAITFSAFTLNAALADHEMYFWHSSLAVYDIVGTLNYVDRDMSDAELEELCAGSELLVHKDIHKTMRDLYSPRDFLPITNDATRTLWSLPINGKVPAPRAQRDAIARLWWHVVTTYPLAFAKHRFAVNGELLSFGTLRPPGVVTRRDFKYPEWARDLGITTRYSPLQTRMSKWMYGIWRGAPIFLPWVYFAIACALFVKLRRDRMVLAILGSGILLELSYLPLAQSPDYRYSHWLVVVACVGVVIAMARARRSTA